MREKPVPTAQQILDLKALITLKEWETFRFFIEDEIKTTEETMFEKEGLSKDQMDSLRNRRNNLKYAIDMPALVVEASIPPKQQEEPDMEVYETKKKGKSR